MSDSTQEDAHTGPIKTPKQLLLAVFFSFFIPVAIIIGFVIYVTSDVKPSGSTQMDKLALGGLTPEDLQRGVAERLQKVGIVEIRDANRPLATGQQVYTAQCAACHTAGVAGAPKMGDNASWANRLQLGFEALVASAIKGKGAMPPQAGGDFNETEIARAVAYMANAAGGKFTEPAAPAAATADAGAQSPAAAAAAITGTAQVPAAGAAAAPAAPAPNAAAPAAPVAAPAAAAPAAAAATQVAAAGNGQALYNQACAVCHTAGVAGAPKLGDKAGWAPRIAQGMPVLVQNAIRGKGAMPPKGGSPAPDAEIAAAVQYMVDASK